MTTLDSTTVSEGIQTILGHHIGEFNDKVTREKIVAQVWDVFPTLEFVKCDAENNPPALIENYGLVVEWAFDNRHFKCEVMRSVVDLAEIAND